MLEDYAFFANGLIDLYEAGFEAKYLDLAISIAKSMISLYYDESGGGFFQTRAGLSDLMVRAKDAFDGALPSGNSMSCSRLLTPY